MVGKNIQLLDNDYFKRGIDRWYEMEKKETGSVILSYLIFKTRSVKIRQKVNISYI